jgi:hypothetical protein
MLVEMANPGTFTISRIELRRVLTAYGVTEKEMAPLFSSMEKAHRHINIIQFTSLLQKAGLNREKIINVFRRLNMNDILINEILSMVDESKISAETGRLYNATLDLGK